MSETRTVFIPAISLGYENNLLESVSVGGETFFRKQRDWRAIAKSREQTIERMGAENAKLRELVRDMFEEIEAGGFNPMVERYGKSSVYYEEDPSWRVGIRERVREMGIEVSDDNRP